MTFGKVKGQARAAKTLSGILATGRLPAAVVFSGMDGVGKTLMAVEFARTLLCSDRKDPQSPSCGFCPDCLAVDQGTHSDLSLVNAQYQAALLEEEPAKQKSLRVDTIRHLRRDMEMRSLMGGWKIAVLEDAHTLEIQSANALLKSLEEPNPRTLWILVSSQRERLPATVLSRCFSVPFSPLAPDIVRRILEDQGTTPERAARAAELCEGSASRALELAESDYPESLTAGIMAPFAAAEKLPREAYLARTQVESALFALGHFVLTAGEFRAPATLVSTDSEHDLALLKIETVGLTEAPIGYAGAVRLDQEIITVGFSFGLREVSVTRGRIAAVRTRGVQRVFQVDAAINPGNSGGAIFNGRGEVVGVMTSKFSHPSGIAPEGMSFAVPISYATPLLANIPDFDFTMIGKGKKTVKGGGVNKGLAQEVVRTTVLIETVRNTEVVSMPPDPAQVVGASPKSEPPVAVSPRVQPSLPRDQAPGAQDEKAIARVNSQLRRAQEEELKQLAQHGIAQPEGMVLVPAGEFWMGAEDGLQDARPLHQVHLSSYWFDKYEVTNIRYRQCVEGGGCTPPKDRLTFEDPQRAQHPVTNITWNQARSFCQWQGKRLPTEAEWEKAARGTDGRRYPWGNDGEVVRSRVRNGDLKAGANGTEPNGLQAATASPYGVFDLIGSVSEWVKDWYAEYFYQASPARDPQGPLRGSFRVLRGGEWNEKSANFQASYRGWDEVTYWGPTLGVRCAEDAP